MVAGMGAGRVRIRGGRLWTTQGVLGLQIVFHARILLRCREAPFTRRAVHAQQWSATQSPRVGRFGEAAVPDIGLHHAFAACLQR